MNNKNYIICFAFMFLLGVSLVAFASAAFIPDEDVDVSSTETSFNAGGASQCIIDGASANWIDFGEDGNPLDPVDATNDCYRENGIIGESGPAYPNCCPIDHVCVPDSDGGDNKVCVEIPGYVVDGCEDYVTEEECTGSNTQNIEQSIYDYISDMLEIDVDDVEGICSDEDAEPYEFMDGDRCWLFIGGCKCSWDSGDEECRNSYDLYDCNEEDNTFETYFDCEVQTNELEDLCDTDGIVRIEWEATLKEKDLLTGDVISEDAGETDICQDGSYERECPIVEVGMPFFTLFNLIITALAIVGVYFVWSRKKE